VADLPRLTLYQRGVFAAHLWKAATRQPHRHLLPVLAPHIPADGVVLDVGAHAGQYTRLFKRLAPRGRVYAFEPAAYARALLGRVVRLRRLRGVEIVAAGLSDAPGALSLSTPIKPKGDVGYGLAHLGPETRFAEVWQETVPLTTIDAFVAERGLERLDYVKADIEGWEMRMLAGASETLARFRPAIQIELIEDFLARAGDTARDVFDLLLPLGYRVFALGHVGRPAPCTRFEGPDDYLFVHTGGDLSTPGRRC
jgi:FkbM family methyltransferase